MSFVLDNSVAMCWLLADGKPADVAYAEAVLDALREQQALVPSLWALEASNVIARAEAKGLLSEARSQAFLVLLQRLNIATDPATAAHALGDTLHLARRTGLPLATLDADLEKAAQAAGVEAFAPN